MSEQTISTVRRALSDRRRALLETWSISWQLRGTFATEDAKINLAMLAEDIREVNDAEREVLA